MGVADFSGGYVIHLAAGASGFTAAWVIGPRLQADRDHFPPNSLLVTLVGAGILWIGWNGFNGGDPYFANADAGAAVLNTNTATAVGAPGLDADGQDGLRQAVGARRGQRHDRRPGRHHSLPPVTWTAGARSSSASVAGIIPWLSMNKFQKLGFMQKVDDTLSVFSTHGVAGLMGGLLTGVLANPAMLEYIGTDKDAPGVNVTGWLYGNPSQLLLQVEGAAFIIVYNVIATFIILKVISIFVQSAYG